MQLGLGELESLFDCLHHHVFIPVVTAGGENGRQGLTARYERQAGNNGRASASVERLNDPLRPAVGENATIESLMMARQREQNAIGANAPPDPPARLFQQRGAAVKRAALLWLLVSAEQAGQRT